MQSKIDKNNFIRDNMSGADQKFIQFKPPNIDIYCTNVPEWSEKLKHKSKGYVEEVLEKIVCE